jgi:hypothetical protein
VVAAFLTTDFTDLTDDTDFFEGDLFAVDVGVALEGEGGSFKVEDETDLKLGDGEVTEELCYVHRMNRINYFQFDYHAAISNEIGNQFADVVLTVMNGKRLLLGEKNVLERQFDTGCIFIDFFIKTRTKFTIYSHRRTDQFLGQIFVRMAVFTHTKNP